VYAIGCAPSACGILVAEVEMRKIALVSFVLVVVAAMSGCPDREETINKVGGAPKEQTDIARERLDKAETKLQDNANAAAAAQE
jgi:hypothetical protein